MLSVIYAGRHIKAIYSKCHYVECRFTECRGADKTTYELLINIIWEGVPYYYSD
jgi:hypothetical protein